MTSIEELRALEAAATPGPWETEQAQVGEGWTTTLVGTQYDESIFEDRYCGLNDAAFIAAARNALPDLLDRLERAERQVAAVGALADEWDAECNPIGGCTPARHHRRLRAAIATDEATP